MKEFELEQKMKFHIKQSDYSQAQIAKKLDVHPSTLSKWMQGVNQISPEKLSEFCTLLNLTKPQQVELFNLAGYKSLTELTPAPKLADDARGVLIQRKRVWTVIGLIVLLGLMAAWLIRYQMFPSWAKAQNQAGLESLEMNDVTQAQKAFEKAIQLDPTLVVAYYNLAELEAQRNVDKQAAIEYLERARELDSNFWVVYDSLSRLYNETKQYEQAKLITEAGLESVAYSDEIETVHVRYGLLSNRGWAYFELGQYDEARDILDDAVNLEPELQAAEQSQDHPVGSLRRSTPHYFLLKLCQLESCPAEEQQQHCDQAQALLVPQSGYFHERQVDIEEICSL